MDEEKLLVVVVLCTLYEVDDVGAARRGARIASRRAHVIDCVILGLCAGSGLEWPGRRRRWSATLGRTWSLHPGFRCYFWGGFFLVWSFTYVFYAGFYFCCICTAAMFVLDLNVDLVLHGDRSIRILKFTM